MLPCSSILQILAEHTRGHKMGDLRFKHVALSRGSRKKVSRLMAECAVIRKRRTGGNLRSLVSLLSRCKREISGAEGESVLTVHSLAHNREGDHLNLKIEDSLHSH